MRVTNKIGWRTPWLRKVVRFCSGVLGYKSDCIKEATFRLTYKRSYRGLAKLHSHAIVIEINPLNTYPLRARPHRGLPELMLADAVELLVDITAHEIAHLARWDWFVQDWRRLGERDTAKEQETERMAREVLAAFRHDRERLLEAWGDSGCGPVHRGVTYQHSCRRCGQIWKAAGRRFRAQSCSCPKCFPSWKAAYEAGEFLAYEEIPPPGRAGR